MKPLLRGISGCLLIDINSTINYILQYSNQITILLNLLIAVITIFKLFHKKKYKKNDKYINK